MSRPRPVKGHDYAELGRHRCPSCPRGNSAIAVSQRPIILECTCGKKGCIDCMFDHAEEVREGLIAAVRAEHRRFV